MSSVSARTIISLIVDIISFILLCTIAYKMYKASCGTHWIFWLLIAMYIARICFIISSIIVLVQVNLGHIQNASVLIPLIVLGLIIAITLIILQIWFIIQMFKCDAIETSWKVALVVLVLIQSLLGVNKEDIDKIKNKKN